MDCHHHVMFQNFAATKARWSVELENNFSSHTLSVCVIIINDNTLSVDGRHFWLQYVQQRSWP